MAQRLRRNGQGSVRQRDKVGRVWQLVYTTVPGSGNERRQAYETFKGPRQDAEKRLRVLLGSVDGGTHVKPTQDTTAEYIRYWLETYARNSTSPRTFKDYEGDARRYIEPLIGHVPVKSLTPEHILGMFGAMRDRGLSERTLLHVYSMLNEALRHGIRWRKLTNNPCAMVDRPRPKRVEMNTLDEAGVATFFKAIAGSPYADVYRVDFALGARRSEVLALRWPQCDLNGASVSIVAGLHRITGQGLMLLDTKTDKSRRRIPIPQGVVDILRAIKGEQIETAAMALGTAWNPKGFVFATVEGRPLDPERVTRDFTSRMKAAGLRGITLHSIRHSFATLSLLSGESQKVVQERLGHSSISVTMDIYSHVLPGLQEEATKRFAERFIDPYN